MGEIAEAMINGLFCEECGVLIDGREPGYPRKCTSCRPYRPKRKPHKNKKAQPKRD